MTEYRGTAEAVRIESDERGWEIHLLTDEGWHVYNIHSEAQHLLEQVKPIAGWWAEGQDAARTYSRPLTEEDLEGYAPGDPKRVTLQRMIDEGRPA